MCLDRRARVRPGTVGRTRAIMFRDGCETASRRPRCGFGKGLERGFEEGFERVAGSPAQRVRRHGRGVKTGQQRAEGGIHPLRASRIRPQIPDLWEVGRRAEEPWCRRAGGNFRRQGQNAGSACARRDHLCFVSIRLEALDQKEKIACFFVDSAWVEVYQPTSLVTEPCSKMATRASSRVARRNVGEAGSWQAPALVRRELGHRSHPSGRLETRCDSRAARAKQPDLARSVSNRKFP